MSAEIVISARFNGPPGSANGGYTCGRVAGALGAEATEVTLRSPPPLERPLAVEAAGGGVVVRDGDAVVAEGRPLEALELELPEPVAWEEADEAVRRGYERWAPDHPFPTCFVCGPRRGPGDGLRIFPGPLGRDGLQAAVWTPDRSLPRRDGAVAPECVWAALDCPTSAPVANFGAGPPIVLARLAARLERPVEAARSHVIVSWPIAADGRKRHAGAALFSAEGERLAASRALWIELRG